MSKFKLFNDVSINLLKTGPKLSGRWQAILPIYFNRRRGDYIYSVQVTKLPTTCEGSIKKTPGYLYNYYFTFKINHDVDMLGKRINVKIGNTLRPNMRGYDAECVFRVIETGSLSVYRDYAVLEMIK